MRTFGRLIFIALALGLLAGGARAQQDASKRARDAFAEGTTFFNLGQWDKAVESWQLGYKYKPDPIFLYNIAQAYRLAENHERAVFFYKSYLRNSPKAPNRLEVQERIDQLQKLIDQKAKAREAEPEGVAAPGTAPTTAQAEPPPTAAAAPPAPAAAETAVVAQAPPKAHALRGDLGISGGADLWVVGPTSGFKASGGFTLTGGYTPLTTERIQLRVGATLGYAFLSDVSSTDHFISALADPMLRVRLWREKLYGFVDVGLGVMIIAGLSRDSQFLFPHAVPSGAFATFQLRPALGLEYRVIPRLGIFLSPSVIYSPRPHELFFHATLLRIDVSAGGTFYF
jgi:hypothetical protein